MKRQMPPQQFNWQHKAGKSDPIGLWSPSEGPSQAGEEGREELSEIQQKQGQGHAAGEK